MLISRTARVVDRYAAAPCEHLRLAVELLVGLESAAPRACRATEDTAPVIKTHDLTRHTSGMSAKWLYIAARGRQDRETGGFRAPIEGRRVGPTEAEP